MLYIHVLGVVGVLQLEIGSFCLENCAAYMQMSVNDRSACIEAAKWCPIHLTHHSLSECNMTTDSRYVCGVDGCKKHHHKSLHGGNTPFLAKINANLSISTGTFHFLSRSRQRTFWNSVNPIMSW